MRTITVTKTGTEFAVTGSNFYTAYKETNLANDTNNDLRFTTVIGGFADVRVRYVDPGGTTAALSVVVSGHDITVNLARAGSAVITTADDVKAAIAASAAASALVEATDKAANDGSGVVDALAYMTLDTKVADQNIVVEIIGPGGDVITTTDVDADNTYAWDLGQTFEFSRPGPLIVYAKIASEVVATEETTLFLNAS